MNVCNEDDSLVIFRDEWATKNSPESQTESAAARADWADYCRARELAERAAAKRACSIRARRVRQELAQAYASATRQHGPR